MALHPLAFGLLFYALMLLSMVEMFRMTGNSDITSQKATVYVIATVLYGMSILVANHLLPAWSLISILLFLPVFFIVELFRKKPDTIGNVNYSMFFIIYLTVPFSVLNFFFDPGLHGTQSRYFIPLGYFLLVWANDIFAYLTGLVIGRHKLYERISPKKTWEGSLGGLIFSMLMAWGLSFYIQDLNFGEWLGMAVIVVIFGTFGDLSESMIKRKYSVKDSGNLLPGHGGILDRLDAMIFSAPAAFCYLFILFK